jgi:putative transposase
MGSGVVNPDVGIKSRKRIKLSKDVESKRTEEGDKRTLFKRKVPLKGCLRSYKVRMYPTPEQKSALRKWVGASNHAYNKAVEMIRGLRTKASFIQIRNSIVPSAVVGRLSRWVLDVPSRIRGGAVKHAIDAQHVNLQEKGFGKFRLQYRSFRHSPTAVVVIHKLDGPLRHFSSSDKNPNSSQKRFFSAGMSLSGFSSTNKDILLRDRRWLAEKLVGDKNLKEDGKILWDKRTGRWYLSVLVDTLVKGVIQSMDSIPMKKVVALDPGVRSFNTYYSPDGIHGELLHGALGEMKRMCKDIDWIRSAMDKKKNQYKDVSASPQTRPEYNVFRRTIYHLKKRFGYVSEKLRSWRTNAHYDAVNFLLGEYDVILIPEFETQKMARKQSRNLNNKTVRMMYTWSHYSFRQKLLSKCQLDLCKSVRLITEPGTSKTCGACGWWNAGLGGSKVFGCHSCRVELDRDINGARNNLLAQLII